MPSGKSNVAGKKNPPPHGGFQLEKSLESMESMVDFPLPRFISFDYQRVYPTWSSDISPNINAWDAHPRSCCVSWWFPAILLDFEFFFGIMVVIMVVYTWWLEVELLLRELGTNQIFGANIYLPTILVWKAGMVLSHSHIPKLWPQKTRNRIISRKVMRLYIYICLYNRDHIFHGLYTCINWFF